MLDVIGSGVASKASGAMGDLTRCSEDVMLGNAAKYARLGLRLHHTAVVSHVNALIFDPGVIVEFVGDVGLRRASVVPTIGASSCFAFVHIILGWVERFPHKTVVIDTGSTLSASLFDLVF